MGHVPTGSGPNGWLTEFLRRRSLPVPDGRPLHRYRCSAEEFNWLREALPRATIASEGDRDPSFGACFCLYAAEWWKRCYREGPWSWQGIRKELGLPRAVRDHDLRGWTERGLAHWKRSLQLLRGRREFVFTLACEGGLPLQLVERDGTHARAYFQRLLEDQRLIRTDHATAEERAGQLGSGLPLRLQTPEVFALGSTLVAQILELRGMVADAADPVAALDQRVPGWRARLPLDMEESTAQLLVRGLLNDAVDLAGTGRARTLRCITLLTVGDEPPHVQRRIRLPTSLSEGEFKALLESKDVPSRLQLFAKVEDEERVALAMVTRWTSHEGQTRFILEPTQDRMPALPGVPWRSSVILQAVQGTRVLCERTLPGGQPLGAAPWLFTAQSMPEEGAQNVWRWLAEGAVSTKTTPCILAAPEGARVEAERGGSATLLGPLEGSGRRLYTISGQVRVETGDDSACTVRTGVDEEACAAYRWMSAPERLLLNVVGYRGVPDLAVELAEGREQRVPHQELQWRPQRTGASWKPLSDPKECFGEVEIRHAPGGETRFRAPLRILPPGGSIELHPRSLTEGTVHLRGMGEAAAEVKPLTGCRIEMKPSRPGEIDVHLAATTPVPPEVCLELRWRAGQRLQLAIPFPAAGACFVGRDGAALPHGAVLHLSSLSGVRARAITTRSHQTFEVLGRLRYRNGVLELAPALQVERALAEVAPCQHELPLEVLGDALQHRFATTSDLDATVPLELVCPGLSVGRKPLITVCRYDVTLRPSRNEVVLEAPAGTPMPIQGMVVEALHMIRAPQVREPLEQVGPNRWRLDVDHMAPGPWLLLGREGAWYRARPRLITLPARPGSTGENPALGTLRAAVLEGNSEKRQLRLDEAIRRLGENGNDPEWELMTHYLSTLGELPATTFDAVVRLVEHPTSAAHALLRADNLFERVWTGLETLPFLWSTVPARAWRHAAQAWSEGYHSGVPAEYQKEVLAWVGDAFRRTASAVEARCPGLRPVFRWLEEEFPALRQAPSKPAQPRRIEVHQDKPIVPARQAGPVAAIGLGRDAGTRQQLELIRDQFLGELRMAHADDHWPAANHFAESFEEPLHALPRELQDLCPEVPEGIKFQQSVVVAPAFAALMAVWGTSIPGLTALELRQLRDFDPSWFEAAFGCTYLSALGIARANHPDRLR